MHILLVGNPRAGDPIMIGAPEAGLYLPLKVLVWEATPGVVRVSLNSTDYLGARHGHSAEQVQVIQRLESLLQATLTLTCDGVSEPVRSNAAKPIRTDSTERT
jgi:uncharacterized protein (DUF302 family)